MNKIISILKPTGMTSHDVVSRVRKILNIKKVGHTGTLDPDASGVLPICIGKATKVCEVILNKDKSYICELTLGISTDTYDASGEILKKVDDFKFSNEDIERAFDTQRGEINQLPPIYSALKVNGKRMCDLVRSGRQSEITLKTRRVNIKDIKILSIKGNKVMFYVECSKGTYVRSICHDIGEYLGCGAHMSFLNRTSSGKFDLDNSITLEELELFYENKTLDKYLYDIDYVLDSFNYVVLNPNAIKYYSNGGSIDDKRFLKNNFDKDDEVVRVYSTDNFLGLGKLSKHNNTISVKSDKMFI
ncbi:tRNA pseudouridine synthase B [Clostridioides difficile]|uniref:tRNA pseudouridine synthase B n=3 Tax=Clostridioides difficile TaxID=1496 RepID=A0A9R0BJH8_CLODR|nr:tRNA pseudouridine(55) synthase TruB [Clostridioides difficile]OFU04144.1 tRNA pseudouridine(55) synthase [Clostridium sp. HMSC19E03]OFU14200.1 tRNA pseudouridine(55) synthase [Clostridium sp. HMSC19C08]OFU16875.1 tRNA pseudouridine(55) synthase [Clostridium sp. HMSC19C09]OFU18541.1 tRNA pseudouridine(55) synthase [Clostridium sp. HMSC19C05]OFU27453.1 tRNA pseudouridine(55) synthase [Clostridium sp. HMSC19B10]OFU34838.1 tRNA pseudouridine(55) synthase [Clostridium sp. HMSC19B11]OFU37255.1